LAGPAPVVTGLGTAGSAWERLLHRPQAAALAALLALTGGLLTARGLQEQAATAPLPNDSVLAAPPPAAAPASTAPTLAAPPAPRPAGLPRSAPTRLDISAIGVRTTLIRLGLSKDGTVEVPPLASDAPAGWYEHSVTPGEPGAAVILGHVDTARDGPAVFYRLRALKKGADIAVRRADGKTVHFAVTKVASYPKSGFPAEDVYGPVPDPVLRLVTCGGTFDRTRGTYKDNIVVSARLK